MITILCLTHLIRNPHISRKSIHLWVRVVLLTRFQAQARTVQGWASAWIGAAGALAPSYVEKFEVMDDNVSVSIFGVVALT